MLFGLIFSFIAVSLAGTPVPDSSETCLTCQNMVDEIGYAWNNATTLDEIVQELQLKCDAYNSIKKDICYEVMNIVAVIPVAMNKFMEYYSWPKELGFCAAAGRCHVDCCAADDPPEQVHLSLASRDSSIMGVSWVSLNQTGSVVEYGTDSRNLLMYSRGDISTYSFHGWVGTIHRAKMGNLKPGTTYYYRVGDGFSKWSEIFSFKTLEKNAQKLRIGVVADMDYGVSSDNTVKSLLNLVENDQLDLIIHSGDISYADGYEPHWDVFMNKIQGITSKIPYMMVPGNHEYWHNFTSYKHRVYMPGTLDLGGSGDNMYYSFTAGLVHFVGANSETAIDKPNFGRSQVKWMKDDLALLDRSSIPWVIANFHRPMYCSGDKDIICGSQAQDLRDQAEEVLFTNEVNVVFTGHVHSYERTYPVYNMEKTADSSESYTAPIHIMQGASGNREGTITNDYSVRPVWSAFGCNNVGFGILDVTMDAMTWKYYDSDTMEVLDSVEIHR